MTILTDAFADAFNLAKRVTRTALTKMRHAVGSSWLVIHGHADYSKADAAGSSIIVAIVRWIQRNFTDAPIILQQWDRAQQAWVTRAEMWPGSVLWLLKRPNKWYSGITLMKGIIADRIFEGTAYIIKVRAEAENVVELWWAPAFTMTPVSEGDDFITYYEYRPPGAQMMELRVEDVIRLPDGMDPHDPRRGLSPVKCLLREIFTDDEAADMTATLMQNLGIPGVILSPKQGTIPPQAGQNIKRSFTESFTGKGRGEPLVLEGQIQVDQFGYSPQQMDMRALRGLPESRAAAVIGVNAAVVGFEAGLSSTKVGATLKEYREEAFESTIIPMYREIAEGLTDGLLDDFLPIAQWRIWYDLSQVRVLQEDENAKSARIIAQLRGYVISVAEARRELGYPILPEHEVRMLPRSLSLIPVGTTPDEQQRETAAAKQPVGRPPESLSERQIRALLEVPAAAREEVPA